MAKDIYHKAVRTALEKDGWTITHDSFIILSKEENMDYEVDLGAEKLLAAEKGIEKITVEIKSFLKTSIAHEFHGVLGQYITYSDALEYIEKNRTLILAIPHYADEKLESYPFLKHLIKKHRVKICVYNPDNEQIVS